MQTKQVKKDLCDFCGPFEECEIKNHTREYLNDLLIDAGVCTTYGDIVAWWENKKADDIPHPEDKLLLLYGYSPNMVYRYYPKRVAMYVRSIL